MAHEENEEDFPGRLLHQAALWGNAELLEDLLHGEMVSINNVYVVNYVRGRCYDLYQPFPTG